ncbi:alpha/beta fold hydrolase [Streptomyces sp. KL118A]|uniref:alpha/beta fold hydrolase n=1 Tax=Streptomyces sp. KL118A TaxID=3045153 RepID=UPI00278C33BE|nr:alpha/beta fold hydrolase [Streptomyces sp. KL118A]
MNDGTTQTGPARARPLISTWGDGTATAARPVLIVHGSVDRSDTFRRVVDHLPGRPVLGYDRRGWGASRPLGGADVDFQEHVDDLRAALAESDVPPVVLGHSYGALVAMAAAAADPSRVAGIVAVEPPVRWLPWWPADDPWERTVRAAAAEGGPEQATRAMLTELLGPASRLHLARARPSDLAADGAALISEMTDPTVDAPAFDPLTFPLRTVVAAGSRSAAHHREVARRLAELLPHGRFAEISGAGHAAHVSHPQELAQLVHEIDMIEEQHR